MTYPVVRLQPGRHKRARAGHPWVYSNEVVMDAAAKALPKGCLVRLEASHGEPLGVATFNPHTLIAARLLARLADTAIDQAFFAKRLAAARDLRERLYPGGFYRLVHAEADGLGGLVIDRYGDVLAVQVTTSGMDRLFEPLAAAVEAVLAPRAIVLSRAPAAAAEGIAAGAAVLKGTLDGPLAVE